LNDEKKETKECFFLEESVIEHPELMELTHE